MANCDVLVVEDDILLMDLFGDALSDLGFVVQVAASPAEAEDHLEHVGEVQALLMDVDLRSSIDGFDLAARVRRDHPNVKVVFVSGQMVNWQERSLGLYDRFLSKPARLIDVAAELVELGVVPSLPPAIGPRAIL